MMLAMLVRTDKHKAMANLLAELEAAENRGDRMAIISQCREGLKAADRGQSKIIYAFGTKLANALLGQPDPVPSNAVEEAIVVLKQLSDVLPRGQSKHRASANRNLAFAYQMRSKGDIQRNLSTAAFHYERALKFFGRR